MITTYRLPSRGPQDLDVCLALTWLLDEHNHLIEMDAGQRVVVPAGHLNKEKS